MSISKVSLCNMALSRVGEQEIESLDGFGKNEQVCNLIYHEVLEQVLAMHNWNCAKFRKELAENVTIPVFGWGHAFKLPVDPKCLKVLYLEEKVDFNVEGMNLVTNSETATIAFTGWVEHPNELDSMLRKVFYLSMAVEMAYRQVENNTVLNGLYDQLSDAWKDARIRDAQEGTFQRVDKSNWIQSRYQRIGAGRDITTRR